MSARVTYPDPCPDTGRRVVTVAEWNNRPDELIDEYAYWFNPEAADVGLDPWRLIEGIDAHTNGREFDVLFPPASFRTVTGEQPIYVRPQHYEALKCAARSSDS